MLEMQSAHHQQHRLVLSLLCSVMCRLYAHTLLVLDDHDFYERQDMFTLAQQRGIATALNALVFRTYCPASPGERFSC